PDLGRHLRLAAGGRHHASPDRVAGGRYAGGHGPPGSLRAPYVRDGDAGGIRLGWPSSRARALSTGDASGHRGFPAPRLTVEAGRHEGRFTDGLARPTIRCRNPGATARFWHTGHDDQPAGLSTHVATARPRGLRLEQHSTLDRAAPGRGLAL